MFKQKQKTASGEKASSADPSKSVIKARNLELKNLIGCPYSNVNLEVKQGQVFAIRGRNGSGKTALLLTLAGRMFFTRAHLEVLGYKMPLRAGKVHRRVGLAFFEDLNELSENQIVRNAVAVELELWGRKATSDVVQSYLDEWQLTDIADKRVGDLNRDQYVSLGVQLAWVGHPDIIVLNDIETGLTKGQSVEIMELLVRQTRMRNVTIVVGVLERDLAAMADAAVYLGEEPASNMPQEADTATRLAADEASGGANAPHGIGKDALQEFSEAASLQPVAREA